MIASDKTSERLVDAGPIAKAFEVSERTVRRWAEKGRLPAVRTPGGEWRFDVAEIASCIALESAEVVA